MSFFKKLFAKNPGDLLAKGERLLQDGRFFEARSAFEKALELLDNSGDGRDEAQAVHCRKRIGEAGSGLARLNIQEAEHSIASGAPTKAAEHLELAISLTNDPLLKEEAARLLGNLGTRSQPKEVKKVAAPAAAGCSSCSSGGGHAPVASAHVEPEPDMSDADHFELLIRQLPGDLYGRYATQGEKFIEAYLAASRDEHQQALTLLDAWFDGSSRDIYCYEKAMTLYRLGNASEAEEYLRESIAANNANPLPHLGLALLLVEHERFSEASEQLDSMIDRGILAEQASLLRGDVCCRTGDTEGAISRYAALLATPLARPAAENLYHLLMECGREADAAVVFKKYLKGKGCGGH